MCKGVDRLYLCVRVQVWRGEHYACTHSEYLQVKRQLMAEMHGGPAAAAAAGDGGENSGPRSWAELSLEEQGKLLKERLKKYTQKVRGCRVTPRACCCRREYVCWGLVHSTVMSKLYFAALAESATFLFDTGGFWASILPVLGPGAPSTLKDSMLLARAGVQACAGQACG